MGCDGTGGAGGQRVGGGRRCGRGEGVRLADAVLVLASMCQTRAGVGALVVGEPESKNCLTGTAVVIRRRRVKERPGVGGNGAGGRDSAGCESAPYHDLDSCTLNGNLLEN